MIKPVLNAMYEHLFIYSLKASMVIVTNDWQHVSVTCILAQKEAKIENEFMLGLGGIEEGT